MDDRETSILIVRGVLSLLPRGQERAVCERALEQIVAQRHHDQGSFPSRDRDRWDAQERARELEAADHGGVGAEPPISSRHPVPAERDEGADSLRGQFLTDSLRGQLAAADHGGVGAEPPISSRHPVPAERDEGADSLRGQFLTDSLRGQLAAADLLGTPTGSDDAGQVADDVGERLAVEEPAAFEDGDDVQSEAPRPTPICWRSLFWLGRVWCPACGTKDVGWIVPLRARGAVAALRSCHCRVCSHRFRAFWLHAVRAGQLLALLFVIVLMALSFLYHQSGLPSQQIVPAPDSPGFE